MLKIKVVVVDKTRSSFLREGEAFYLKRLSRYVQMDRIEVKPVRTGAEASMLAMEGRNIERNILPRDYFVALDRTGKQMKSEEFAAWLDRLSRRPGGWVVFVVGSHLGLSEEILRRAARVLSLSKMTFTHEMSRVVLLEQLYRAMTILKGESYHK